MNKIPLEVIALTSSATQLQSYSVVLGEADNDRRLSIVIGAFEAQSIAVALEQIKPSRPLTHDLICNMLDTFGAVLQEVVIYRLSEGIFYANLICEKDGQIVEIDSRTSDAVALAIRTGCIIYTYENILNEAAGLNENINYFPNQPDAPKENPVSNTPKSKKKSGAGSTLNHYTIEELKEMMIKATESEDYDLAIQIRDELKARGEGE